MGWDNVRLRAEPLPLPSNVTSDAGKQHSLGTRMGFLQDAGGVGAWLEVQRNWRGGEDGRQDLERTGSFAGGIWDPEGVLLATDSSEGV